MKSRIKALIIRVTILALPVVLFLATAAPRISGGG
jgi:hypothetical protein